MARTRPAAFAAAAALLLAGCSVNLGWTGTGVESAPETREVPAGAARVLEATAECGDVRAEGVAGGTAVEVTAVKRAPTVADLDRVAWTVAVEGDRVRVGYAVTGDPAGCGVSFAVKAPAPLRLVLRSSAGNLRASGFGAGMDARTDAGNVEAEGVAGDLELRSDAGNVSATGASGTVRAGTDAGNVRVEGRLRGECRATTDAGNVEAVLPADSRLAIDARTSAGSVRSDFPLAVEGRNAARALNGKLGGGGEGTLLLQSDAGNVSVRAAR